MTFLLSHGNNVDIKRPMVDTNIVHLNTVYDTNENGEFANFLKSKTLARIEFDPCDESEDEYNTINTKSLSVINYYNHLRKKYLTYMVKVYKEDDRLGLKNEVTGLRKYFYEVWGLEAIQNMYAFNHLKTAFQTQYYLFYEIPFKVYPISSEHGMSMIQKLSEFKKFEFFYNLVLILKAIHLDGKAHNYLTFNSIWINEKQQPLVTNMEYISLYGRRRTKDVIANPITDTDLEHEFFEANAASDIYSLIKVFFLFFEKFNSKSFFFETSTISELKDKIDSCIETKQVKFMKTVAFAQFSMVYFQDVADYKTVADPTVFEAFIQNLLSVKETSNFKAYESIISELYRKLRLKEMQRLRELKKTTEEENFQLTAAKRRISVSTSFDSTTGPII